MVWGDRDGRDHLRHKPADLAFTPEQGGHAQTRARDNPGPRKLRVASALEASVQADLQLPTEASRADGASERSNQHRGPRSGVCGDAPARGSRRVRQPPDRGYRDLRGLPDRPRRPGELGAALFALYDWEAARRLS